MNNEITTMDDETKAIYDETKAILSSFFLFGIGYVVYLVNSLIGYVYFGVLISAFIIWVVVEIARESKHPTWRSIEPLVTQLFFLHVPYTFGKTARSPKTIALNNFTISWFYIGEIGYYDTFSISISLNVNGVVENIFQGRIGEYFCLSDDDSLYGYRLSCGDIDYVDGSWNNDLISVLRSHIEDKSKSLGYSNRDQLKANVKLNELKRLETKKKEEELRQMEIASKYSKLSEDYSKNT